MPDTKLIEAALEVCKDESKLLGVKIGGKQITPGEKIPKADAQSTPELTFIAPPGTTYIAISLDLDAPFPSFAFMSPIAHWIQPNLTLSTDGTALLSASTPAIASYVGPGPPPPSAPHRYVFLLYEQPAGFDVEKSAPGGASLSVWKRARFDFAAWVRETGVGAVVAANYFVSN